MKPENPTAILSSAYLAPVNYYSCLKNYPNCLIEKHENFIKQTYRSRCDIYTPNGVKTLSIPLVKREHRQSIKDIRISYDYDWQKLHWRTLESSYRRSPFFEFFEDDFYPYYHDKKFDFLIDLNEALQQEVFALLKMKPSYKYTDAYIKEYANIVDLRNTLAPKAGTDIIFETKPYSQVFETRHGFIPNLSILDLLFNQGNRATEFI